jgi:hypothetical protein
MSTQIFLFIVFENLELPHVWKNFLDFCGIRMFITVFTKALHLCFSCCTLLLPPFKIDFNIILSSTPRLSDKFES